ncbi:MAG: S8 family peptidase [Lachnospiraceae bacterium]|nr:S8 family peptidase [Lachnospiraceae bacterium]
MQNEKLEEQLNLALSIPADERAQNAELNAGYDEKNNTWELIVRYSQTGDFFLTLVSGYGGTADILAGQYAIVILPEEQIDAFSREPAVIYVEKAKNMRLSVEEGIEMSCPLSVKAPNSLYGAGVLIGIVDSGIDILHPDFIRGNGKSVIDGIWDQTVQKGNPPEGFQMGTYYSGDEIQTAVEQKQSLVTDPSGHGTHVASIAAGNKGVAKEAQILFVKLGRGMEGELSRTTNLMRAVDFLIKIAEERRQPIAINISFGTNYGDHFGGSLLESYLNAAADLWQNVICTGTGNEGDTGRHCQGKIILGKTEIIEISVAPYETFLNLQIWKEYKDEVVLMLRSPSGEESRIESQEGFGERRFGMTKLAFYYGTPTPYNRRQEIFLSFLATEKEIESGIWTLFLIPKEISNGSYAMWLPVSETSNRNTRFLMPELDLTLTIPSTAWKVISVGAYDGRNLSYAPFSGRGSYEQCIFKPDLAAPGVNILGASPGGGETIKSGTSMAVPFVTGACAILMEWGIVRENDRFLYGEKIKAYLQKGAKKLPVLSAYPNNEIGWGVLCIQDSFPN